MGCSKYSFMQYHNFNVKFVILNSKLYILYIYFLKTDFNALIRRNHKKYEIIDNI